MTSNVYSRSDVMNFRKFAMPQTVAAETASHVAFGSKGTVRKRVRKQPKLKATRVPKARTMLLSIQAS